MKLKDFKNEIKVLDIAALVAKAKALRVEINDGVLDKNMNKLKNLKSISKNRKDLARVMTVLSQKKMIQSLETAHPSSGGKETTRPSNGGEVTKATEFAKTEKSAKEVKEEKGEKVS